jgi:hypothetical protein
MVSGNPRLGNSATEALAQETDMTNQGPGVVSCEVSVTRGRPPVPDGPKL